MKKILLILITLAIAVHSQETEPLFSADDHLYSTIISLSRETHGWLYQYASADLVIPGATLVAVSIWPDKRFKVLKFWSPDDDSR